MTDLPTRRRFRPPGMARACRAGRTVALTAAVCISLGSLVIGPTGNWSALSPAPAAAAAAEPEVIRPIGQPWQLTLPAGWRPVPDAMLRQVNAAAEQYGGVSVQYVAGMGRVPPNGSYALVQLEGAPPPGYTLEQILASSNNMEAEAAKLGNPELRKLLRSSDMPPATLDAPRARLLRTFDVPAPGGQKLKAITASYIGKSVVVNIHCYAPPDLFDTMKPDFDAIFDGFTFDSGAGFVPPSAGGNSAITRLLTAGLIGGIIGGVIHFGRKFTRK